PSVSENNQTVDRKLDRIVMRLLAKDPEKRFATTIELVEELKKALRSHTRVKDIWGAVREGLSQNRWTKWAVAALVAVLVATSTLFIFRGPKLPEKKILVVLPFRVIGSSRGDQFYTDGVAEILTGRLSQLTLTIQDLQVVPASEILNRKVDTAEKARAEF